MDHLKDHFRTDIKPLVISQPEGPSFTISHNTLKWQKWSMVVGFNAREGVVFVVVLVTVVVEIIINIVVIVIRFNSS